VTVAVRRLDPLAASVIGGHHARALTPKATAVAEALDHGETSCSQR